MVAVCISILNGKEFSDENDLHRVLERELDFGPHYGRNLAALRDRILTDVPRPVLLVWGNSEESRNRMGSGLFERVVNIFEEAVEQDLRFGWSERFEYRLE